MNLSKKLSSFLKSKSKFALLHWKLKSYLKMREYRRLGVKIGKNTTVSPAATFMDHGMVEIGDDCSISGVVFVTHDGGARILSKLLNKQVQIVKPIKVGNRCVIGASVTIKYGVTIGDDCIVAMGSTVIKDVAPGTMVGGNPCKVIGDTFAYRARIDSEF